MMLEASDLFRRTGQRALTRRRKEFQQAQAFSLDLSIRLIDALEVALHFQSLWPEVSCFLSEVLPRADQEGQLRGEWTELLTQAISCAEQLEALDVEGELLFYLGRLYMGQSDLPKAAACFRSSATCFDETGSHKRWQRSLLHMAYTASSARQYVEATETLDQINRIDEGESALRAQAHAIHGMIAFGRNDAAEAKRHFEFALILWEQDGTPRQIATGLTNLGTACRVLDECVDAIAHQRRAITIAREIRDPQLAATAALNLANVLMNDGQCMAALAAYDEAEAFFLRTGDTRNLAAVANGRGMTYWKLQWLDDADLAYERSLAGWRTLDMPYEVANVLLNVADLRAAQGRLDEAHVCLDKAGALLTRIQDEKVRHKLHTNLDKTRVGLG